MSACPPAKYEQRSNCHQRLAQLRKNDGGMAVMTPLTRTSLSLRTLRRCLRRGLREQFLLCLLQAQPKDLFEGSYARLSRLQRIFRYARNDMLGKVL